MTKEFIFKARVDADMAQRIRELCKRFHMTPSQLLRRLIEDASGDVGLLEQEGGNGG